MRLGRLLLAVTLLGASASCSGSDDERPAPTTEGEERGELDLGPDQVATEIGATFDHGGFEISLGEAVYDEATGELFVGARVKNLTHTWATAVGDVVLRDDGEERPLSWYSPKVPPGVSAEVTLTTGGVTANPFDDGTIVWGRRDVAQQEVGFRDGERDLWRAASFDIDRWAHNGRFSTHVTRGEVLAGSAGKNLPAKPGERVLRISVEVFAHLSSAIYGFTPGDHLTLARPDGTTVKASATSAAIAPIDAWTATPGAWLEFPITEEHEGDYELLLSSVSTGALGTYHPELIERVAIPFTIDRVEPRRLDDRPAARPDLHAEAPPDGRPVDLDVDVGAMNVPGFSFEPTRLQWEPAERTAWIEGTATFLQAVDDLGGDGLLDTPPGFSFNAAIVSAGRYYTGVGGGAVDPERGTKLRLEFLDVSELDPDDVALFIGRGDAPASSLPLTTGSDVPAHPPAVAQGAASSPPATAADWTVRATGHRLGMVQVLQAPPPGYVQLEISFEVSAAPNATAKAFGLVFSPRSQLYLAGSDGYLTRAVGDSGNLEFEPGQTKRASITFNVPDSFKPGRSGMVLRGNDDGDVWLADEWVETTFPVDLGISADSGLGG